MSQREFRATVSDCIKAKDKEKWEIPLISFAQGQENVNEQKLIWFPPMIYFPKKNLAQWRITNNDKCKCRHLVTLKHIFSNYSLALDRYYWRHN